MGPCTASPCCCQARNLPWAPVPTPHAAARPVICPWAPVPASSCCCQVQSVSWVPVRPPIAAVSIATLCHVPLSGLLTLLVVSIFVIGLLYMASHCCCCLHRHTVGSTLWFWPRDCPNEVKCAVILRSTGTHLHVIN
ncbi:unnamed protein product [Staurois parvus]|uniref:Uncharacterized protein n=1 Tax=Staurois parvus TaxID=386267 RepID=A0ABN9G6E9_9NEOB|nr:unnamed protein product [Staurois parvus]